MGNKGFRGWYFKHQKGDDTIALIPGEAESGAFIQMLDRNGTRQFSVPECRVKHGIIHAGRNLFSRQGIRIDLPGVQGTLFYGKGAPLRSDIMGPFRFLPMQCRHEVISMQHSLFGTLTVDGEPHCFDDGYGYLEKDSGTSFPQSYLWLQCNDFPSPCALMLSIAHIPFAGSHFTGCICAILYAGQEYRLATYRGVRIDKAGPSCICLTQGKLKLQVDIATAGSSYLLRAPRHGHMSSVIRESCDATIRARLWHKGELVFDLSSSHAAFEYVPMLTKAPPKSPEDQQEPAQ